MWVVGRLGVAACLACVAAAAAVDRQARQSYPVWRGDVSELALSLPGHCQPRGIEKISACAYTVAVRVLAGDDQVNHVLCTSTVVDARCAKQQHLLLHRLRALH